MSRARPFLFVLLLVVSLAACEQPEPPPPPAPPEVTVATPERRDVQAFLEFTGRTEAFEQVEIRARVRGFLEEIHYSASAHVRRGQLLFSIEDEPYIALRDQADAEVLTWQSELARAQADLERLEEAVQSNAVSVQDVDSARAQRDQADASLKGAKARLVQAELDLSYTEIHSPIAGQANRWFVDRGNLVGSGDNTLLTTVVRMDPVYAYWEMSESVFLDLLAARGRSDRTDPPDPGEFEVFMGLGNEDGWPHEGSLDYVDSSVDSSTGTIQLRGVFPNPDGKLFPGLFARIRIPNAEIPAAVLIQESAIGTDLGGKYVYVVDSDNIVEQRTIQLGPQEGQQRVVVAGLEHGERYIVNGMQRARPGLPVTASTGS